MEKNVKTVGQLREKGCHGPCDWASPPIVDDVTPRRLPGGQGAAQPHAHAIIEEIDTSVALKVPGMVAVYTWKDVPQNARSPWPARPTPSPAPTTASFWTGACALWGTRWPSWRARTKKCVDKALKLIKVRLSGAAAGAGLCTPPRTTPSWSTRRTTGAACCPVGADNKRNLCAQRCAAATAMWRRCWQSCDVCRRPHLPHQGLPAGHDGDLPHLLLRWTPTGGCMWSAPPRSYSMSGGCWPTPWTSPNPRSMSMKPRIGGGFGAKQTVVAEVYPAFVTWKTEPPRQDDLHPRKRARPPARPATRWRCRSRLGATQGRHHPGASTSTPCPTPAPTASTAPPRWACPATSPFPCTPAGSRPSASSCDVVYTNAHVRRCLPGLWGHPGHLCSGVGGERAGRQPATWTRWNCARRTWCGRAMIMPAYYNEVAGACALDRCMTKVPRDVRLEGKSTLCGIWATARCARRAWPWPCRAPAFPAWTWAPPPSS